MLISRDFNFHKINVKMYITVTLPLLIICAVYVVTVIFVHVSIREKNTSRKKTRKKNLFSVDSVGRLMGQLDFRLQWPGQYRMYW